MPVYKEIPSVPELKKRKEIIENNIPLESRRFGKLEEFYDEEPEIEEDGAVTFYNPTKTNGTQDWFTIPITNPPSVEQLAYQHSIQNVDLNEIHLFSMFEE